MLTNEDIVKRYTGPFTLNQVISFNIPFIEEDDILATLDGTALSINSDYSVTPITSDGLIIGADVTILKAFPSGNTLVLERRTDATQEQDYPENGPFESTDIERSLDKLTMLIQENRHNQTRFIEINLEEKDDFDNMLPKANENRQIVVVTEDEATLVDIDPQEIQDAIDKCQELADEAEASATQAENCATQSCQCASAAEDAKDAAIAAQEAAEEAAGNAGTAAGDLQQAVADAEAAADAAENAANTVEDIYNQVKDLVLEYEPPLEIEEDTVTTPDNIDTDSGVTITSNVATSNGNTQFGMVHVDFGTEINLRTDTFEFSLAFVDNSGDLDNSAHDEDRTSFISLSTNAESAGYNDTFAFLDYTYATAAPYVSTGYRAGEDTGLADVIEKLKDITYGAKTTVKFEGLATNPATVKVTVTDSAGTQTRTIPVEEDGAKSTFKSATIQLGTPTSTGAHIPNRDISLYLTGMYLKVNNVNTWVYQPATSTSTSTLTLNYGSGLTLSGNTLVTDPSVVTRQGNTFNTANKLVKLDADGKLPALDGSNLTNISGGGGGGGDPAFDEVEYPLHIDEDTVPGTQYTCWHNWTENDTGTLITQGDGLNLTYDLLSGTDADDPVVIKRQANAEANPAPDTYDMSWFQSYICIPYQLGQIITTGQSGSMLTNEIKAMSFGYFNEANQFIPVWNAAYYNTKCRVSTGDTITWQPEEQGGLLQVPGNDGDVDLDDSLYQHYFIPTGNPLGFQIYKADSNNALHFTCVNTYMTNAIKYVNTSNRKASEVSKITHALILPEGKNYNISKLGLYSNSGLTSATGYPWLSDGTTWEILGENLLDIETLKNTVLIPGTPSSKKKILRVDSYSKEETDALLEDKLDAGDAYSKTAVDGKISEINGEISNINGSISEINGEISAMDDDITALSNQISSIDVSINAVEPLVYTPTQYSASVEINKENGTFTRKLTSPSMTAREIPNYTTAGSSNNWYIAGTYDSGTQSVTIDTTQNLYAEVPITSDMTFRFDPPFKNTTAGSRVCAMFGYKDENNKVTHLGGIAYVVSSSTHSLRSMCRSLSQLIQSNQIYSDSAAGLSQVRIHLTAGSENLNSGSIPTENYYIILRVYRQVSTGNQMYYILFKDATTDETIYSEGYMLSEQMPDINFFCLSTTDDVAYPITGRARVVGGDRTNQYMWTVENGMVDSSLKLSYGDMFTVADGALTYILPPASTSTLGGVKIGNGLSVAPDGTLSASTGGTEFTTASPLELAYPQLPNHGISLNDDGTFRRIAGVANQDSIPSIGSGFRIINFSSSNLSGQTSNTIPINNYDAAYANWEAGATIVHEMLLVNEGGSNPRESFVFGNLEDSTFTMKACIGLNEGGSVGIEINSLTFTGGSWSSKVFTPSGTKYCGSGTVSYGVRGDDDYCKFGLNEGGNYALTFYDKATNTLKAHVEFTKGDFKTVVQSCNCVLLPFGYVDYESNASLHYDPEYNKVLSSTGTELWTATIPNTSETPTLQLNYDNTLLVNEDNQLSVNSEGLGIPTKTSDLTNDSGYITKDVDNLTNYTLSSSLAVVAISGSYNDLDDLPEAYTLPAASDSVLGGVKVDGTTITATADGTISAAGNVPANMATTDTEQTITAPKTLNANLKLGAGNAIVSADDLGNRNILTTNGLVSTIGNTTDQTIINGSSIAINRWDDASSDVAKFELIDSGNIGSHAVTTTQGLKVWSGTEEEFTAIATKDDNTLYFVTEGA